MITKADIAFVRRCSKAQLVHWLGSNAKWVSIEGYKGYSRDELETAVLNEIDIASSQVIA